MLYRYIIYTQNVSRLPLQNQAPDLSGMPDHELVTGHTKVYYLKISKDAISV